MSEAFDPEKVTRWLENHLDMPAMIRAEVVLAADYDKLLALYRGLVASQTDPLCKCGHEKSVHYGRGCSVNVMHFSEALAMPSSSGGVRACGCPAFTS